MKRDQGLAKEECLCLHTLVRALPETLTPWQ